MIEYLIFKIIYIPIFFILGLCASAVLFLMLAESGWDVPIRWICIVAIIAAIADYVVNK
jgi:hypothetical protein